jgi:hypothetical protein
LVGGLPVQSGYDGRRRKWRSADRPGRSNGRYTNDHNESLSMIVGINRLLVRKGYALKRRDEGEFRQETKELSKIFIKVM